MVCYNHIHESTGGTFPMSYTIHARLDPAAETITLLERTFTESGIPPSLEAAVSHYGERFSIPAEQMEELISPLLPMEAELLAVVQQHRELWESMFYPNSRSENLMAWSFFFLDQQEEVLIFDLHQRCRLMALTLNCPLSDLGGVDSLDTLFPFLEGCQISSRTKWICARLWKEPEVFLDNYRRLMALTTPIVEKHTPAVEELLRSATDRVVRDLHEDPDTFWNQLGMTDRATVEDLIICPLSNNFNGLGLIWDHTRPQSAAFLMVGVLRQRIRELVLRYSDNSEFLTDRLKSLSDQRRLEILKALKHTSMYGQELAELLKLSPATISHHMSTLVSAGFVSIDRKGSRTSYTLHRQNLKDFLDNLKKTLL